MNAPIRYHVEHATQYAHSDRVATSQHVACLQPRELPRQRVLRHALTISPEAADISHRVDYFGNHVSYFEILTPYEQLLVSSRTDLEVQPAPPIVPAASPPWEDVRDAGLTEASSWAVGEFCYASPFIEVAPELEAYAQDAFGPGRPILEASIDLMRQIHRECRFDPGATTVTTPVTRILSERHGVCQDFAHLQIACLRSLGLPARYVSGYLLTDPPEGQPRLIGADASHAWLSVWCPRHGWVDLDPTNDVVPSDRHITIAWGRDYGDVCPLRGVVLGGGEHTLSVGVSVVPQPPDAAL